MAISKVKINHFVCVTFDLGFILHAHYVTYFIYDTFSRKWHGHTWILDFSKNKIRVNN